MLHYQVGSKLCLNQLQWDSVRPSGHRGPSGRGRNGTNKWGRVGESGGWMGRGGAGMREGYGRAGFALPGGWWLEFVLISGVWGHMRVWR